MVCGVAYWDDAGKSVEFDVNDNGTHLRYVIVRQSVQLVSDRTWDLTMANLFAANGRSGNGIDGQLTSITSVGQPCTLVMNVDLGEFVIRCRLVAIQYIGGVGCSCFPWRCGEASH